MLRLASHPFLNLNLHTDPSPVLETEWLGFAGTTEFRETLTAAIAFARTYQATGWVADDRHIGTVRPENIHWVATHLLPALAAAGIRRFALLESAESMNRFLISNMYEDAVPALPLEFETFTDLAAAREWAAAAPAA